MTNSGSEKEALSSPLSSKSLIELASNPLPPPRKRVFSNLCVRCRVESCNNWATLERESTQEAEEALRQKGWYLPPGTNEGLCPSHKGNSFQHPDLFTRDGKWLFNLYCSMGDCKERLIIKESSEELAMEALRNSKWRRFNHAHFCTEHSRQIYSQERIRCKTPGCKKIVYADELNGAGWKDVENGSGICPTHWTFIRCIHCSELVLKRDAYKCGWKSITDRPGYGTCPAHKHGEKEQMNVRCKEYGCKEIIPLQYVTEKNWAMDIGDIPGWGICAAHSVGRSGRLSPEYVKEWESTLRKDLDTQPSATAEPSKLVFIEKKIVVADAVQPIADDELNVIKDCYDRLSTLSRDAQVRAMDWLINRLEYDEVKT